VTKEAVVGMVGDEIKGKNVKLLEGIDEKGINTIKEIQKMLNI
jgi:hypothetical protein